jgi:hypothetical protein
MYHGVIVIFWYCMLTSTILILIVLTINIKHVITSLYILFNCNQNICY